MTDRPDASTITDDQLDQLYAQLGEAADALYAIGKALIVVEPTLKQPYPDAPHTSPWERFVHQPAKRAYNLGWAIRRQLKDSSPARKVDPS